MENLNPNTILRVGVDLAKRVYQIHAVNQFEAVAPSGPTSLADHGHLKMSLREKVRCRTIKARPTRYS